MVKLSSPKKLLQRSMSRSKSRLPALPPSTTPRPRVVSDKQSLATRNTSPGSSSWLHRRKSSSKSIPVSNNSTAATTTATASNSINRSVSVGRERPTKGTSLPNHPNNRSVSVGRERPRNGASLPYNRTVSEESNNNRNNDKGDSSRLLIFTDGDDSASSAASSSNDGHDSLDEMYSEEYQEFDKSNDMYDSEYDGSSILDYYSESEASNDMNEIKVPTPPATAPSTVQKSGFVTSPMKKSHGDGAAEREGNDDTLEGDRIPTVEPVSEDSSEDGAGSDDEASQVSLGKRIIQGLSSFNDPTDTDTETEDDDESQEEESEKEVPTETVPVLVTPDKKSSPPQPMIVSSPLPEVMATSPNEEDPLLDNPSSEMERSEHSKELFDQEDDSMQNEADVSPSTSIDPNDATTPIMGAAVVVLQTLDEDTVVQDVEGGNYTEEQVTPFETTKDLVDCCSDDDQVVDVLQDSTSEHSEKEMEGATTSEEEQEDTSEDKQLDNSDDPDVCVERVEGSTTEMPHEESGNATHFNNSVNETHDKEAVEDTTENPMASDLRGAELPHKPQDDLLNTTAEMTDSDESADSDESVPPRDDMPLFVENNPAHEIANSSSSSVVSSTSVDEEDESTTDPTPEVAEMEDKKDISKETAPESETDVAEDGSPTLLVSMGETVLAPDEKESTNNDETNTIHMNKVEVDDLIAPDDSNTTDMDPAIVPEVQEQELPSEIEDNDTVQNGDDKEPQEHVITTGETIPEIDMDLDSTDFENQETIVAMKEEAITVPEINTINEESADAPIVLIETQLESKTDSDSICDIDKESAYVKQDETISEVQSELVLSLRVDEIVPEENNVPIETEEYPNEQVEQSDPNGNAEPREEASD
eukprot:scaffold64039_cov50-Attheya_sp.AAC.4